MTYRTPALRSEDTLIVILCAIVLAGAALNEFDSDRVRIRTLFSILTGRSTAVSAIGDLANAQEVELWYFPTRGRAEHLRMLLNASSIAYTERQLDAKTWFGEHKSDFKRFHFGQVPALRVKFSEHSENVWVSQSAAIARLISRSAGGALACESVECDELMAFADDIRSHYSRLVYNKNYEQEVSVYVKDRLNPQLHAVEQWLANHGNTAFLAGDELTFVDVLVSEALEAALRVGRSRATNLSTALPVIAYLDRVAAHDHIAPFLASPERAERPQNGASAFFGTSTDE